LDLSAQEVWDERMCAAGQNNDPAAFRTALKSWEQAGLLAAPLRTFSGENEAKAAEPLTQGVSGDSRGCHAR
jgi:hypothetical protein